MSRELVRRTMRRASFPDFMSPPRGAKMPQPVDGIESCCCQVMLRCSMDPCALRPRLSSVPRQLATGTSSVRQPTRSVFPFDVLSPRGEVLVLRSAQHDSAPLMVRIAPSSFARNNDSQPSY